MKFVLFSVVSVFSMAGLVLADMPKVERTVEGHVLSSEDDPALRVHLPESAEYVGSKSWILYGASDIEMHVFVEADADKVVQRYYQVQFEAIRDDHPDSKYDYPVSNPETMDLDGYTVHVRPGLRAKAQELREGSDTETMIELVSQAGYVFPANMLTVRFVHLPTPDLRKEMIVLYGEDMSATIGMVAQKIEAGEAGMTWADMNNGLVQRAAEAVDLKPF